MVEFIYGLVLKRGSTYSKEWLAEREDTGSFRGGI